MSPERMTRLKVGFTTVLALAILVVGVLWLKNFNPMEKTLTVSVRFDNARGITGGDPVFVSGIKVGEVTDVILGENSTAIVKGYLNGDITIHPDYTAEIGDVGLMGDKALVIHPGTASGEIDGSVMLDGSAGSGIDNLFAGADTLMTNLNLLSQTIRSDVRFGALNDSLMLVMQSLRTAIAEYETLAKETRTPLRSTLAGMERSTERFNRFIDTHDARFGAVLDSFHETSNTLNRTLERMENASVVIDTMAVHMQVQKGTLTKLITRDELYEEIRRTNAHIDSFVTDVRRNPGKYTKDMKFKISLF